MKNQVKNLTNKIKAPILYKSESINHMPELHIHDNIRGTCIRSWRVEIKNSTTKWENHITIMQTEGQQ